MEIPINNFDLSAAATSSPISFSAPYHPQSSPVHDFPSQAGAHLIILNMLSPAESGSHICTLGKILAIESKKLGNHETNVVECNLFEESWETS